MLLFFYFFLNESSYLLCEGKLVIVSKRRIRSGQKLKMQAQTSLLNLGVMGKTGQERRRNQGQFLMQSSSLFRSQAAADRGWCDLISMKSGGSVGRGALRISRLLYCLPYLPKPSVACTGTRLNPLHLTLLLLT